MKIILSERRLTERDNLSYENFLSAFFKRTESSVTLTLWKQRRRNSSTAMLRHSSSCIFLLFLLYLQEAHLVFAASRLHCEMLPAEECAFSVDSSGKRCVLREHTAGHQNILICQTSNILVGDESPMEYIENEQCVKACGVEKMTVGFAASTYLYRDGFLSKLCSRECKHNCPNLVDLYSTLAMVVGKQGEFSTHTDLCVDWMHKSRNSIRFS